MTKARQETVEEFLARGGTITHEPTGKSGMPRTGKRLTQKQVRDEQRKVTFSSKQQRLKEIAPVRGS